jgi:ADP-ribose pyrophosphatase YjhB (NUDIX family)
MLRKTIGKFWKILPRGVRTRIVRATQNTFTVSVAAIIVNERREVLLLDHVLRPRSGWGFPGGFLDANEHAQTAVEREVREETGLALENVRLMRVLVRGRHVEIIFAARPVGKASVQSSEIYQLGWFDVESLPEGSTLAQKMLIGEVLNSEI